MKITGARGLIVGLVVGNALGLWTSRDFTSPVEKFSCIVFASVMGLLAGCILWLVDKRRKPVSAQDWSSSTADINHERDLRSSENGADDKRRTERVAGSVQANVRSYTHVPCGGDSEASGFEYLRLSNPFAFGTRAKCSRCKKAVPIAQVIWTDTGENVAAYLKRLRRTTSFANQLLFWSVGIVPGGIFGFVVGACFGLVILGRTVNRGWWQDPHAIIPGLLITVTGAYLGTQLLTPLLSKHIWKKGYCDPE